MSEPIAPVLQRLLVAFALALSLIGAKTAPAVAQEARPPLRITITEGVSEPVPIAIPPFIAEGPGAQRLAEDIPGVIGADLAGSGLFRVLPPEAHLARITSFDARVSYDDWRAINAQGLVTGAVSVSGDRVTVKFRLYDVFAGQPMGEGVRFSASRRQWRRIAHKIADAVFGRITGEKGYFDSRIAFVAEAGPKGRRIKRIAIMDQDGANLRYLTDGRALVLSPHLSADGRRIVYTSYVGGAPRAAMLDVATGRSRILVPGETMSFAPRLSPDGRSVVYSAIVGGNVDLYRLDLATGTRTRLTRSPGIDTEASFSPDGRRIVFVSDRSGSPQLYVMPAAGGEAQRISFGPGRYGSPAWSPRGDRIAFTRQGRGRFHIGIMRPDGSDEKLLTTSFLDEGPSWAPNGRVIVFFREPPGEAGTPALFTVNVNGRNLRRLPTPGPASDPSWSGLLP